MAAVRRSAPLRAAAASAAGKVGRSSRTSTVALGTAYEHAARRALARPPFHLTSLLNVGGAGDGGVDLRGRWTWSRTPAPSAGGLLDLANGVKPYAGPPHASDTLDLARWDALVQCKAERDRVGPATVRELEGAVLAAVARSTRSPTISGPAATPTSPIGILVAMNGFSAAALQHAQTSAIPLVLAHLAVRDVDDMVRTRGRQGDYSVVNASINRALRSLVEQAF